MLKYVISINYFNCPSVEALGVYLRGHYGVVTNRTNPDEIGLSRTPSSGKSNRQNELLK